MKRSFLGFQKYTCEKCQTKNYGVLGKISLIIYVIIFIGLYALNIYDVLEYKNLPIFSTLFDTVLRGAYPWVILIGIILIINFKRSKNVFLVYMTTLIVFGTPVSIASYGEYAKHEVKQLMLKANIQNYALSERIQILNSLLSNPNIGNAEAIKLIAESSNQAFDIRKNYEQLKRELIMPNTQFIRIRDFLQYKSDEARVLQKVFNDISIGKLDSIQFLLISINNYQKQASDAIGSKQ